MQVIPVIDLKNGLAVRAVQGRRQYYRPLQSRLCASPEPQAVLQGLLRLHPFRCVYLADLDALTGQGNNRAIIQQLLAGFPALEFWIDQGWTPAGAEISANHVPVLGSESLSEAHLPQLSARRQSAVLSLDFFGEDYCGPPGLLDRPQFWPERVILMTLARVGSQAGPDWRRLDGYMERHPQTRWIAAGGVRHAEDLRQLAQRGVHAVLLASALHDGGLSADGLPGGT
ncbi:MAG: hypothetical protein EPN21_13890 [Methylococcaceae bacterium]|nr:MAG: hypothetical protein EPN21_13890 [Methylococcaceae bacterium]